MNITDKMGKAKKIKVSKNVKGSDSRADQINQGNYAAPSGEYCIDYLAVSGRGGRIILFVLQFII